MDAFASSFFDVDSADDYDEPQSPWVIEDAIELCKTVERIAPRFGCHVALTGGALYKDGPRKDVDILFYRIRQVEKIDQEGLLNALEDIGLIMLSRHGWVQKAAWEGKKVDIFFPDHVDGDRDPLTGEYA